MNNLPQWFSCWTVANSLLCLLKSVLVALPVMIAASLLLGRTRQRYSLGSASALCLEIALFIFPLVLLELILKVWIDLRLLPASMGLQIPSFAPFEPIWKQGTYSVLLLLLGAFFLLASSISFRKAPEGDGERQMKTAGRLFVFSGFLSIWAFVCFFGSAMMENWPFLGYPYQMDTKKVFQVIFSYTWHNTCASLMPAGAVFTLLFYLTLPKGKNAEEAFSDNQKVALRMGLAFALAGGAFQVLDAGFLAFSFPSMQGVGLASKVGQYIPFFVTSSSVACWIYLFSKPRPQAVFIALIPVLLLVGRSILRI